MHNLHGMPGIIGGLVAGFAAFGQPAAVLHHTTGTQLGVQVRFKLPVCTLTMATTGKVSDRSAVIAGFSTSGRQ